MSACLIAIVLSGMSGPAALLTKAKPDYILRDFNKVRLLSSALFYFCRIIRFCIYQAGHSPLTTALWQGEAFLAYLGSRRIAHYRQSGNIGGLACHLLTNQHFHQP